LNANAVATDSGTGTGTFKTGIEVWNSSAAPLMVRLSSSKGYDYRWNYQNQTIQVFLTGASSGAALSEAALGATLLFDNTITFEALLIRSKP
jgi:hypothetical protein